MTDVKENYFSAVNCTTGYVNGMDEFICDLCHDGFWFNPTGYVQCEPYFLTPSLSR
jgi:hypothetical protein